MSGPTLPSPVPRSASTGPNNEPAPNFARPMVNGVGVSSGGGGSGGGGGAGGGSSTTPMSQQNLNQIVIDYLAKKGYTRTEAMLRAESATQDVSRTIEQNIPPSSGPPKYQAAFEALRVWVEDSLDVYKPELQRLLWPIFVHCYLKLVATLYPKESRTLMEKYSKLFKQEHEEDIVSLERITLPEHMNDDNIAKLYCARKYWLTLSEPAYLHLIQFLESAPETFSKLLKPIVESNLDLRHVDRASDDRFSFASVIRRSKESQDVPAEDEGIPGHRPGNAISSTDPKLGTTLANLKLGKLQMDRDLEGDVRADLEDLDAKSPPGPGRETLVQTHEAINIKQEDDDDGPTRTEISFPPSTARDVAMEVQKVRENRDRFKLDDYPRRTGGIGPGVSVCMYTFHNTFDSITCLDFSGDNALVAAGTSESYIRVWTLDGSPIPPSPHDPPNVPPSSSRRLIGHSGPVYAVSFAPATPAGSDDTSLLSSPTSAKFLLSSSADSSVRLWSLPLSQTLVVYKAHLGPVWSIAWSPFGYYFASAGHDKTARIWSTDQIRPRRFLAGHDQDVDVIAWHPNSAYVFTGSSDKTVRMWALSNGGCVRMFTGHVAGITALACAGNGKILASADERGEILLWDLGPGRLIRRMRGHGRGGVWSLSFSAESAVLVSGGQDGTVRVWDVNWPPKSEAAKVPGEAVGGKTDAASGAGSAPVVNVTTGVNLGGGAGGAGGGKRKAKEAVVTGDQISAFPTKTTPVYRAVFTGMNLVLAGGAYMG